MSDSISSKAGLIIQTNACPRCVPVTWIPIDPETIIEEHGDNIFDSPSPDERQHVDLHTYDLLDDRELHEQCIYDADGCRIPRRQAALDHGIQPAGILFELRNLHELFETEDDGFEESTYRSNHHYVYPIACLQHVGYFQAHGIFNCFMPQLEEINQQLSRTAEMATDQEESFEPDEGWNSEVEGGHECRTRPPYYYIKPVASQGYSAFACHVRAGAHFHDIQKAMISTAFAGTHASVVSDRRKAEALRAQCFPLPFESYHQTITGDESLDQSLRVENVFTIEVHRLPQRMRRGRQVLQNRLRRMDYAEQPDREIYLDIVQPLTRMWDRAHVLETIKDHVLIFKEGVSDHVSL